MDKILTPVTLGLSIAAIILSVTAISINNKQTKPHHANAFMQMHMMKKMAEHKNHKRKCNKSRPTPEQKFDLIDENKDGNISKEEFLKHAEKRMQKHNEK